MRTRISLLFLVTLPLVALAQEGAVAAGGKLTLFEQIQQGGFWMLPLGLCSLVMLFLIIYGYLETSTRKFVPTNANDIREQMRRHDIEAATASLNAQPTVLARALAPSLLKLRADKPNLNKEKAETLLLERLEAEENNVSQWVNYLNVVAAVAPMIGLLGTVSGMIGAFQTIAQGGMGRPELLGGDIGEALITTATGLVIGIPAMIFYFILRNRLNHRMILTTEAASDLMDSIEEDSAES